MSGHRNPAHLPDPLPALPDARRSGVVSALEQLAVRQLSRRLGASPLAASATVAFTDPLGSTQPARSSDARPPATTPTFIEPQE